MRLAELTMRLMTPTKIKLEWNDVHQKEQEYKEAEKG